MTVNIGFEARVLARCLSCQGIDIPNSFTALRGHEAKPFTRGWPFVSTSTDIPYSRPDPRGGAEDHLLAHARTHVTRQCGNKFGVGKINGEAEVRLVRAGQDGGRKSSLTDLPFPSLPNPK